MVTLGTTPISNLPAKTGVSTTSLRDIVFTLFRRKWIIFVIALPIIILGGLSLFRQTGAYTASSKVVVELMKVDLPQWNTSGRNVDYDRELSTLFNIAMSVPVAEVAARALMDSIPVIREFDSRQIGMNSPGALKEFLLGGLNVSVMGESSILEFQFTSAHPRISLMAVGALRDAFIEYQVHGRKNVAAIAYYEEQVTTVRGEIDSLLATRRRIMEKSNYSSLKDELRVEVGQLADVQNQLLRARANRRTLEVQYENLKSYLVGDPREFPVGIDESRSQTLVYWRTKVGNHENELIKILSVHTEDSLPARRQQDLLARALERLRQEENAYVESIRLALLTIEGTEEELQDQIAELRERNSRAPQVYQEISLLDVEINSLRGLMGDIMGKMGEVRLSQLADERVSSIAVLTEPELAVVISGGKTIIYFILIIVFGVTLGLVAALIMESMDHRVYIPKDVEEGLNLPVFASVTRED